MFIRKLFVFGAVLIVTACVSGYAQFYTPAGAPPSIESVKYLSEGQEPILYSSNDIERDTLTMMSRNYHLLGYSSFNGELEGEQNLIRFAKEIGATVVLTSSEYTNTESSVVSFPVTTSDTTYNYGNYSSYGNYNTYGNGGSTYGNYSGSGTYSGTSTTYSKSYVPITVNQRRYDQSAAYFVQKSDLPKLGVIFQNLDVQTRSRLARNTGVSVVVVVEKTPAFVANIVPGDIIVEFNGEQVIDFDHLISLFSALPSGQSTLVLGLIRPNGAEQDVSVSLNL